MPSTKDLSLPLIASSLPNESTEKAKEEQSRQKCSLFCGHFLTLLLSLLLFLQFGAEFQVQSEFAAELRWSLVNFTIALFTVASFLLKEALVEVDSLAFAGFLPELIALTVSGLIFYDQLIMGFLIMLAGMFSMGVAIVAICAYQLLSVEQPKENVAPSVKIPSEVVLMIV